MFSDCYFGVTVNGIQCSDERRRKNRVPLGDVANKQRQSRTGVVGVANEQKLDHRTLNIVCVDILEKTGLSLWKVITECNSTTLLSNMPFKIDGFAIFKTITIYPGLNFSVSIGNMKCDLKAISEDLPPVLSTDGSLLHVVRIVGNGGMCLGCDNVAYVSFEKEVFGHDGNVSGTARMVSDGLSDRKVYFSNACLGILPVAKLGKVCENCLVLDRLLRVRLHRARNKVDSSAISNSTGLCYLSASQLRTRLTDERILE